MLNYFSKDSCAHNSDYRCFSCLFKFGRSGEHLSEEADSVKVLTPSDDQKNCARKRPALHLWQPPLESPQVESKRLCLQENWCVKNLL